MKRIHLSALLVNVDVDENFGECKNGIPSVSLREERFSSRMNVAHSHLKVMKCIRFSALPVDENPGDIFEECVPNATLLAAILIPPRRE